MKGTKNVADYLTRIPGSAAPSLDMAHTLNVVHVNDSLCKKSKHVTFADTHGQKLVETRVYDPTRFAVLHAESGAKTGNCKFSVTRDKH